MGFFFDKLYTSQNVCQSAIYNACILFCDCLKITKQITQKAQRQVQALYNDCYHKTETFPIWEKKYIYNMYTGLTALFLHLSLFKNIVTFLCRFCFFSVQHFAAKKQGVQVSPKVILLIFSDRCHCSHCSVQMPSVSVWHSSFSCSI